MKRGKVILAGAGHAHMEAVRRAHQFRRAGLELVLIDPGMFWYSGAITGVLSGELAECEASADPAAMAGPVQVIRARVICVDSEARLVHLDNGESLEYAALSLNTGSRVARSQLVETGAIPVKPASNLANLRKKIEAAQGKMRLVVAGAGATGVETALSLAALQRRLDAPVRVMLAGEALLADWPEGAARKAQAALGEAGVERVAARALRIENGAVIFSDQQLAPADAVIAATGLEADLPDGLDAGPEGLPVGSDLAWAGDDRIFASGDCAWMSHAPRPKLGVFGVRAAPVLIGNLILAGRGARRRKTYRPQSRWLSIMDMGDGTGLGRYGPFSWRGEAALKLKRRIDGAFTARYTGGHD